MRTFTFQARQRTMALGRRTRLMGIVNVTPDSFSDGGRFHDLGEVVDYGLRLVDEGADILDIGGESTRPGAVPVPEAEEIRRIRPVIEALRRQTSAWLSIDTYKAEVAQVALESGADLVNDISALRFDPRMAEVVLQAEAGLILMHSRGDVRNLHSLAPSPDIWQEVVNDLQIAVYKAFKTGISRDRIMLDPGLGFGKTTIDNLRILNRLSILAELDLPILVGPSRKRFIGDILQLPVEERLVGTTAAAVAAVMNGAHVLRIHDVREVRQALAIVNSIASEEPTA